MTEALELWRKLPAEFLKIGFARWCQYGTEFQRVIVKLATDQRFECAFCDQKTKLEIEHDHEPYEGSGDCPTVDNVRGLACRGCNCHLWIYEKDQAGENRGFVNVDYSKHSDRDYENYIDAYGWRVHVLREDRLEKRLGGANYWSRSLLLGKFDDWMYDGRNYPWHWGFEEIKDQKYGCIRTPRQFLRKLHACVDFVAKEYEKNPDFKPPDSFVRMTARVKPWLDGIMPIVEARLRENGSLPAV